MSRLFFALYPHDNVRNRFASIIHEIAGARSVIPENLHLTLHFIGETDAQDCLIDHADKILCKPFTLIIDQYGYFKRAKVLWAGPNHSPDDLTQLVQNCAISSEVCGGSDYEESFTPHVSLMRKVSDKPELQTFEPFEWNVHSFYLMKSEPDQAGLCYRVVREFPMQND